MSCSRGRCRRGCEKPRRRPGVSALLCVVWAGILPAIHWVLRGAPSARPQGGPAACQNTSLTGARMNARLPQQCHAAPWSARAVGLVLYLGLPLMPHAAHSQKLVLLDGPPRAASRSGPFSFTVRADTTSAGIAREIRYLVAATNVSDTTAWLVPALCDALELRSAATGDTTVWLDAAERTCLDTAPHHAVASRDSLILTHVLRERSLGGYLPAGAYTVSIRLPQPRDPRGNSPMPTFPLRASAGRVRWRP